MSDDIFVFGVVPTRLVGYDFVLQLTPAALTKMLRMHGHFLGNSLSDDISFPAVTVGSVRLEDISLPLTLTYTLFLSEIRFIPMTSRITLVFQMHSFLSLPFLPMGDTYGEVLITAEMLYQLSPWTPNPGEPEHSDPVGLRSLAIDLATAEVSVDTNTATSKPDPYAGQIAAQIGAMLHGLSRDQQIVGAGPGVGFIVSGLEGGGGLHPLRMYEIDPVDKPRCFTERSITVAGEMIGGKLGAGDPDLLPQLREPHGRFTVALAKDVIWNYGICVLLCERFAPQLFGGNPSETDQALVTWRNMPHTCGGASGLPIIIRENPFTLTSATTTWSQGSFRVDLHFHSDSFRVPNVGTGTCNMSVGIRFELGRAGTEGMQLVAVGEPEMGVAISIGGVPAFVESFIENNIRRVFQTHFYLRPIPLDFVSIEGFIPYSGEITDEGIYIVFAEN